jgi:hypothetical protein
MISEYERVSLNIPSNPKRKLRGERKSAAKLKIMDGNTEG